MGKSPLPADEAAGPHPSIAALARVLVKTFYGRVEVQGLDLVPSGRPLVYVANHVNSLVDGALLLAFMPRPPRMLGTSELWRIPVLKPFLAWAAAIPVYRRHVEGFDRTKNVRTFGRCHEVLAAGGHIGILPEGTSHSEPTLVRIRTGVARIVLEAAERFGDLGTRIVPVGFTFEDRTRFRSDVLVQVGEPIDPAAEIELYREKPRAAVRALTGRVREAMWALTLNFPSWEEADRIEQAAELYLRPPGGSEVPMSESVALLRTFIGGYQALKAERPDEVEKVAAVVDRYDEALRRHRLDDAQVAAAYRPAEVVRFTARSLWLVFIRLPLGLVGTAIHLVPFLAAGLAAKRLPPSPDQVATYKVLGSLVFYLATWIAVAATAGWYLGWPAALLALVLAPVCGGVALRLFLRGRLFWRRARAFLLMRSGRPWVADLRRLRGEAREAVVGLVKLYGADLSP